MKLTFAIVTILIGLSCYGQNGNYISQYGNLFDSVQLKEVFSDQKKFVDCPPKHLISDIKRKYSEQRATDTFDLRAFIARNFDTLFVDTNDLLAHINHLWNYLARTPDAEKEPSTLLPLPHPYIVPGGRFREIYYWDSYFTMLGLKESGHTDMIKHMLDNFTYLIEDYGHIPNGNRTYYLSRSQPPFYALMIQLYADMQPGNKTAVYEKYRQALEKEYAFWMRSKRAVAFNTTDTLNRYWDAFCKPRPESFKQDVETKNQSGRDSTIYRDIRAAAESGWDFSSRWFSDGERLQTIHTTNIIPIDLNCLLYNIEMVLSAAYAHDHSQRSAHYSAKATKRKKLVINYCWNEEKGCFFDYNIKNKEQTGRYSLATLYPLFFNMVESSKAQKVAAVIDQKFLKDGGLVTTPYQTGQQWDYPNGWAPLQWIGYKSFTNYGLNELAHTIATRWIHLNARVFFQTNKMMEKYDVVNTNRKGGGGEYELQDGFGWTNGVFLRLWNELQVAKQ